VNARIVSFDSDDHLALQGLLPWFANGTLPRDEAAQVEAHLAQCTRCRADLDGQVKLRTLLPPAVAEAGGDDDAATAERRWSALRVRLDADAAARPPARTAHAAPRRRPPRRPTRWLPWAFGLQTAFVLALALLAGWNALTPSEPYRALGTAPAGVAPNALVVFRPDATEQQMRLALRAGHARLVGGPTVTDAYLLQIGPAADIADAVARLRAQPGVLRVESLEATGAR